MIDQFYWTFMNKILVSPNICSLMFIRRDLLLYPKIKKDPEMVESITEHLKVITLSDTMSCWCLDFGTKKCLVDKIQLTFAGLIFYMVLSSQ